MDPRDQARQIAIVSAYSSIVRTSDMKSNPSNGTVVADTGSLSGGFYDVIIFMSSNCALGDNNLRAEWRNDANTGNVQYWEYYTSTSLTFLITLPGIYINSSERFRLYVQTGFTGLVAGSITCIRRA